MKIRGLPASIPGETLFSWSFRCAQRNHQDATGVWLRLNEIFCAGDAGFEAPIKDKDFYDFFSGLDVFQINIMWRVFNCQNVMLLDKGARSGYCPLCLLSDVKEIGLPCWRLSWCDVRYVYCREHNCLLSSINSTWTLQTKSWMAFADTVNYGVPRGQFETPNAMHPNLLTQLNLLISRAQEVLLRVRQSEVGVVSCMSGTDEVYSLGKIYLTIFSLLLRLRTAHIPAGVARYLLSDNYVAIDHGDFTYEECLSEGVSRSSPYQRMVALLLLGWIVGLFNEDEVKVISRIVEAARYVWPRSLKDLGRMAGYAAGGDEIIRTLEGKCREGGGFGENITLFVAGLKESY